MKRIQVFEYHPLKIGVTYDTVEFTESHFNSLVKFNELHKNKYFTVGYKKIICKHYVGALQVNDLVIEILPKADNTTDDKNVWQSVLIDMLKSATDVKIKKVGQAHVNKQNIHLLDIYFEWFLNELQLLIHQGLIKKYYKETKNTKALKGKLEFAGHIQKNLVHKERFYTTHQVYDKNHILHQVLSKALDVIENLSKGSYLYHKCKKVQLNFPEVSNSKVTEATFNKIILNRKTAPYETVLSIARFIILNYAPNVSSGKEKMFALLFNMNNLWESYVLVRLKKYCGNSYKVLGQQNKTFWGDNRLRPDIVLKEKGKTYIIDTKWKCPKSKSATVQDLRQMYTYCRFWNAEKALLLYPGEDKSYDFKPFKTDDYSNKEKNYVLKMNHQCKMGFVSVVDKNGKLSKTIGREILETLQCNGTTK
ncbi:McrC family protein [Tenacibaculum halocynthiae]|uniref:McrC family protein n=1 Tax=Tenacibaculum halocynthiae TaxID=1254437 RepID=UPI003D65119B